MNIEIIIAGLALFITIVIDIATIAFFAGVLKANQVHQKEMLASIKNEFNKNFERLEQKQDRHNSVIERQFVSEGNIKVLDEKIEVANHRIADLEGIIKGVHNENF